ncbi:26S proteasome regulatory subunit [Spironucleus salmonicida]|uniref:26S proteasome regulatory subunit n=1 Tax=Spironucleus salmonicida TaxID=348837 RepID=V6LZD4_9EUKA|nr:26S proteasome regulatory subunit [Spironucleus salmonicida]|eukprot:EST46174.1 26S proteasome regulatory subunit [Spironucleus salmonicida]
MQVPQDDQLLSMLSTLPQQWFLIEQSRITFYEKYAQTVPNNEKLHHFLATYFHLVGDTEKCAFYVLHGSISIEDPLILASVETAVLDFVIFKSGGGLYGASCLPITDDYELNTTKTKTKTVVQDIRKPFSLMDGLNLDYINGIVDKIISRSSIESQVSWKVHTKTLLADELNLMNDQQLSVVYQDVLHHTDSIYREQMIKTLQDNYYQKNQLKHAVDCVIQLRSVSNIVQFISQLIKEGKYNEALQTAFNVFESTPQKIVNDVIYELQKVTFQRDQEQQTSKTIFKEILTGQISTQLYCDFMKKYISLDRVALRKMYQQNSSTTEQIASYFLMHVLMTLSTQHYEHKANIVDKHKQYPRLGHYSQIGLVYRGHHQTPKIYDSLFQNFATVNPYEIGGASFGLALQFAGLNTVEAAPLALIMDINNQLDSRNEEDRGPILHGLALAIGLISLGQHDEEIVNILAERLDSTSDIDAKFAILLSIGLVQLGNAQFFDSDIVNDSIKPYLACEHEKLRRGSALAISFMCFRAENQADHIIHYLLNFAISNPNQFADSVTNIAPLALGLAFAQTGSIAVAQRLLLLANDLSKSFGAQFAIQSIGIVFCQENLSESKKQSIFQLLSMCSRSFDPQIRTGACYVLGQIFAASGDEKVVELLCKLMTDQEEQVRCGAYIAQALVLQTINGVELPESLTAEYSDPVGDKQKNCFYKCDYETEEMFDLMKNQMKLYATPGNLQERYKEIYVNKHSTKLSVNQYATQFRRDLMAVQIDFHESAKESQLTVRSQMIALGIMNSGGLNLSFKQRTDLQLVSYVLFLQSWFWYPMMGVLGLCMECDYITTVQFTEGQIQEMQLILAIPSTLQEQYGYSALAHENKHQDVEKYVKKARLSQNDLANKQIDEDIPIVSGYGYVKEMKDIAMEEFALQADNVKLTDVLQKQDTVESFDDEWKILETPVRLVDNQVERSKFAEGTDFEGVFPGVKRGVVVVKEVIYE